MVVIEEASCIEEKFYINIPIYIFLRATYVAHSESKLEQLLRNIISIFIITEWLISLEPHLQSE